MKPYIFDTQTGDLRSSLSETRAMSKKAQFAVGAPLAASHSTSDGSLVAKADSKRSSVAIKADSVDSIRSGISGVRRDAAESQESDASPFCSSSNEEKLLLCMYRWAAVLLQVRDLKLCSL